MNIDIGNRNPQMLTRLPAAILMISSTDDIPTAISCARLNNIIPVPRSGGHSYEVITISQSI